MEKKTEILAAINKYLAQLSKEDDAWGELPLQKEQDAKTREIYILLKLLLSKFLHFQLTIKNP